MGQEGRPSALDIAIQCLGNGTLSIDSGGRIWRHKVAGKPINPRRAENIGPRGYLRLTLGIPGNRGTKCIQAHRVVWSWLKGPIPEGLQINHKDLNKANNKPDNLDIVTGSENMRHSYENGRPKPWHKAEEWRPGKPRIDECQISDIMELRSQGLGSRRISKIVGVSRTHVDRLLKKGGGR